jgi:hypothetical protein
MVRAVAGLLVHALLDALHGIATLVQAAIPTGSTPDQIDRTVEELEPGFMVHVAAIADDVVAGTAGGAVRALVALDAVRARAATEFVPRDVGTWGRCSRDALVTPFGTTAPHGHCRSLDRTRQ